MPHQVCGQCQRNLPAASYYRSKSNKDGITGKCKECSSTALSLRTANREVGSVGGSCADPVGREKPDTVTKHIFIEVCIGCAACSVIRVATAGYKDATTGCCAVGAGYCVARAGCCAVVAGCCAVIAGYRLVGELCYQLRVMCVLHAIGHGGLAWHSGMALTCVISAPLPLFKLMLFML